jgi:hypothetical protein
MKKTLQIICFLFISQWAAAQATKTELLDLIKTLVPDSASTATFISWPKTNTVKWKSPLPKKEGNNYVKRGSAAVIVKGKNIKCQGVNDDGKPCKWDVILTGGKTGYTSFTIAADNLHVENDIDMIDYFFGKQKVKAQLLKKDIESFLFWNYDYKIQLPGKKDIWMRINYENLTSNAVQAENNNYTDAFYIDFYFSESAMN